MSLFTTYPLWLIIIAVPVLAFATAGMWATMKSIPQSLQGVYRMHIYAPPAAFFIGTASFICMIAPFTGLVPADEIRLWVSALIAVVFAVVGYVSLKRGGHAALLR
jgi:hypothetical protein